MKTPTAYLHRRRSLECATCSGACVVPEEVSTRELSRIIERFEQQHRHCAGWDEPPAAPPIDDRPELAARIAAAGLLAEAVRAVHRLRHPPPPPRDDEPLYYTPTDVKVKIDEALERVDKALAVWDRPPRAGRLAELAVASSMIERTGNRAVRDAVIFAAAFCSERRLDLEHQARLAELLSAVLLDMRYDSLEAEVRARITAIFARSAPETPAPAFPYIAPDRGFVVDLEPGDWLVTAPGGAGEVDRVLARCRTEDELRAYLARAALPHAVVILVAHATARP